jgi:hypothetical protein
LTSKKNKENKNVIERIFGLDKSYVISSKVRRRDGSMNRPSSMHLLDTKRIKTHI